MWETNWMQQWWFIDIQLAQHVSGNFLPIFRNDRPRCSSTFHTEHTVCASALWTTARQQLGCRKPQAVKNAVCRFTPEDGQKIARNVLSYLNINKSSLWHLVGLLHYFILRMHGQTNIKNVHVLLILVLKVYWKIRNCIFFPLPSLQNSLEIWFH
jgi:hypothetical protein